MAVFAYKATDSQESNISGSIVADTPRQARDLLRDRGLRIEEINADRASDSLAWWQQRVLRRHRSKVVSYIRELATLLSVGTPLLQAMDTLAEQYADPKGHRQNAFYRVLLSMRERVAGGASLAQAMAQQPILFDELCVHMTEVGESAGTLENSLERLGEFKERASQFKSRVATALLYPAIVLVMALGISVGIMTFVVPKLLAALIEAHRPLPWVTRVVKGTSDFLIDRWWLLILIVLFVCAAITLIMRMPQSRMAWHRLLLKLPIIGNMQRKQAVVRLAIVMSALLKSGVVFVSAIQIAQRLTKNLVTREALAQCEQAVTSGRDIAQALRSTGVFPPLVVQVFAIGQQSGRLEEMLDRLAADYDRQLNTVAQRLTAVLEPALILFLVIVVGFIAFATILPMLEAADVL